MAAFKSRHRLLWVVSRHSVNRQRSFSSLRRLDKPPPLAVVSLGKTDEPQRAAARTMAQGRRRIGKARVDLLLTTDAAAARSNPIR
jgi:hypothetical protein